MKHPVEHLDEVACRRLLARRPVARLAVRDGEGVDVFPVDYGLDGDRLVLRTTHGAKLNDLTIHPDVALEIDGQDGSHLWSVVVRGRASTPELGTEIERLHGLGLPSRNPLAKSAFVVIEPTRITGRRFIGVRPDDED
jgi:nitroimidazol reductase NimA-like FMN-containing flavoprotein (pyridoxamine 5'-phosphate oxidase superfamily)